MSDHIDGTAEDIGTDVVPTQQQATTLFRTNDPVQVLEQAERVADALKRMLSAKGLTVDIQGREHVRVEGWTTLGSMLGVVPVVVWSRPIPGTERTFKRSERVDGNWREVERHGNDWEARVEARTLDGRIIGAAEATCSRDEGTWEQRDDYALRSMAQTRATSKALRGPLGFVVTLAGYDATPAEEMPRDGADRGSAPRAASEKQLSYVASLAGKNRPLADAWAQHVGVPLQGPMSSSQASNLIEGIKSRTQPPTGQSDVSSDPAGFEVREPTAEEIAEALPIDGEQAA
jgi:hypothetical protein